MDVRLHLAAFVESKFLSNNEVDDATATNLANQLMTQFEAKIAAIPNEPDKFLSKSKLQDMYDNLKVRMCFYFLSLQFFCYKIAFMNRFMVLQSIKAYAYGVYLFI